MGCSHRDKSEKLPLSVGLLTYKGQYLTFNYPSSAKLALVSTTESVLLGPSISNHPDQEWGLPTSNVSSNVMVGESRRAYQVFIYIHDNPMKLKAESWARSHIIQEWKQTQGGPTILPISHDGHILEDFVGRVTVGKAKGFMVETYGYDTHTRSLYFARDNVVIELRFLFYSLETDPLAILQKDIYALILGTMAFVK